MKKFLSVILGVIFIVLIIGCDDSNTKNNISSVADTIIVDKTYKAETKGQTVTTEKLPGTEILSNEDRAAKEEIAKHIVTDIDFRYNKREIIKGKTFNLTFSGIEIVIEGNEKVVYKNESEDVFKYNAKSGKLHEAIINSAVTQKTNESINENEAQKIAVEYAKTKYEINAYRLYSYKETTKGHSYIYTRYIGGYPSSDKFSVKVGYDGNIVYVNDFTDVFSNKDLNYSKEFIDSKIKEYSDEMIIDWESINICVAEGKVAVSYVIPEQHAVAVLPLE